MCSSDLAFLHSQSVEEAVDHTERYFARLAAFEAGEGWGHDDAPDESGVLEAGA